MLTIVSCKTQEKVYYGYRNKGDLSGPLEVGRMTKERTEMIRTWKLTIVQRTHASQLAKKGQDAGRGHLHCRR